MPGAMTEAGIEMRYRSASGRERAVALAVAGAIAAGLLAALWLGLSIQRFSGQPREALALFDVVPAMPQPPVPLRTPSPDPEGEAAPPALRAEPSPVTAPEPVVVPPEPEPAPPLPGEGTATRAGAAEEPGPGTGAGGEGAGRGSGGSGSGTGSGVAVPAQRIRGGINIRDFSRAEALGEALRPLVLHLSVDAQGRVTGCTVAQSSGRPALDTITCRLAQRRFRYRPARDASGNAVPDVAGWRQQWWREQAGE